MNMSMIHYFIPIRLEAKHDIIYFKDTLNSMYIFIVPAGTLHNNISSKAKVTNKKGQTLNGMELNPLHSMDDL
jgi:hypothetical protein